MTKSMLIVEDEQTLRESLERLFIKDGFKVATAESAELALAAAETAHFDIIISDIILPGIDGIEMLSKIREQQPSQIFIVITAYASMDTAVRALKVGAYDYIMKPVMHEEIRQVVNNAMRQSRLERENMLLKRQVAIDHDFTSIIGENASLKSVLGELRKISDTKSNILLLGETGTGKELFARVIHHNSSRRDMPFVPINCSAIPESLLESELFGHMRGSFTGAVASKNGLLEEADGGTVFLDEIGDMPSMIQVKLLRVIEDQEIRPIGSTKIKKIDIRLITATNKDLEDAVAKGGFREDLYYRINVISLNIPPLRERIDDLPALTGHFLRKYSSGMGKRIKSISDEAMALLSAYNWPGNIRELQNVIERAVLISDGDSIETRHLPANIFRPDSFIDDAIKTGLSIEDYTRAFVLKYQDTHSEQELARKLGITRKTLWEKRKKWGLRRTA